MAPSERPNRTSKRRRPAPDRHHWLARPGLALLVWIASLGPLPSCSGNQPDPADGSGGMGGDAQPSGGTSATGGGSTQAGGTSSGGASGGGSSSGGSSDGGSSDGGHGGEWGGSGYGGWGGDGSGGGPDGGVSELITPEEGGTLSFGTTTVTIPPGALAVATTITLAEVDPSSLAELPAGFTGVGPAVALLPHGLTFDLPVTVTLGHSHPEALGTLVVLSLDDEEDPSWEDVPRPSFEATTVSFETESFSIKVPAWPGSALLYTDEGPEWVGHLALGGGKLFYSIDHPIDSASVIDIRSINANGSGFATVSSFDLPDSGTNALLTTTTTLFFAAGQSVYSLPLAGGTPTSASVACGAGILDTSNNAGIPRMVADTTQLYCTTTIGTSGLGELKSFSFSGTPVATVPDLPAPGALALDGSDLLYAAFGGLFRIPKTLAAASTATVIDSDEFAAIPGSSVRGIVHDATNIYVLTTSGGQSRAMVWRKPRSGGALQAVTTPLDCAPGGARGLVLVGSNLYFALQEPILNQDSPSVLKRVRKAATSATPDTLGGANQSNLVTDGTYVYYGNGTDLHRLPN